MVEEMCTAWANEVCSSCGVAEGNSVKLNECTACMFVRYCSVECEKQHILKHSKVCKKPAILRDELLLFKQPESSHEGDCPICCLPLPLDLDKFSMMPCCCKQICNGCIYANRLREMEQNLVPSCPFCRKPLSKTDEEAKKRFMERVKANDPLALCEFGKTCDREGDYDTAFKSYAKAAELGDIDAQYRLGLLYHEGDGVEKDEKKEWEHLEKAAIGGHHKARHNLGCYEGRKGNHERAVKSISSSLPTLDTINRWISLRCNLAGESLAKKIWKQLSVHIKPL